MHTFFRNYKKVDEIDKVDIIRRAPLFAGITPAEQDIIALKCKVLNFMPQTKIFEQGDPAHSLYILVHGRAEAFRKKEGSNTFERAAIFTPGDSFGELAIIKKIRRVARVMSVTPCTFLKLSSEDFLEAYKHFPKKSRDNIQLLLEKIIAARPHDTRYRPNY